MKRSEWEYKKGERNRREYGYKFNWSWRKKEMEDGRKERNEEIELKDNEKINEEGGEWRDGNDVKKIEN